VIHCGLKKNPASTVQAWRQTARHWLGKTPPASWENLLLGRGKCPTDPLSEAFVEATDHARNERI
jgi:hypothetical protein